MMEWKRRIKSQRSQSRALEAFEGRRRPLPSEKERRLSAERVDEQLVLVLQ